MSVVQLTCSAGPTGSPISRIGCMMNDNSCHISPQAKFNVYTQLYIPEPHLTHAHQHTSHHTSHPRPHTCHFSHMHTITLLITLHTCTPSRSSLHPPITLPLSFLVTSYTHCTPLPLLQYSDMGPVASVCQLCLCCFPHWAVGVHLFQAAKELCSL